MEKKSKREGVSTFLNEIRSTVNLPESIIYLIVLFNNLVYLLVPNWGLPKGSTLFRSEEVLLVIQKEYIFIR